MRDDDTLKAIRDGFEDDDAQWDQIRQARKSDLKALSPDSTWDDRDRQARKEAGRPCLSFDELTQFCNQLVNDAREQDRAIEVNPQGADTSEAQARLIGAIIRQIEYRSNAQLAYTRMFEDAAQGSYGFLRVTSRYLEASVASPTARSFEQELWIRPVHNPDLVTPGFFTLPDFSDCKRFWVHESYTHEEFKRAFPDATLKDFTESLRLAGPRWVDPKRVWVRELWELKTHPRKLALLPGPDGAEPMAVWVDTIPKAQRREVLQTALKERTVDEPRVTQTLTNGCEVLQEAKLWPGRYIPIVGCVGKILWIEDSRQILSLIRNAKDAQQLYNYYRTSEAEVVGMTPKVPWFAYKGSLDQTNRRSLAESNQRPVGVVEVDPSSEQWSAQHGPLPFPQRQAFEPPIQALEMGAESTRRAIMSATGTGFLPTEAQRQNQKSGVALREIATSAQKGAFHFVDHYEHAIRRVGEIIVDLIPHYYDTARDLHVRLKNQQTVPVRVNDPQAPPPKDFADDQASPLFVTTGEFEVTIASGPSYASEREKASEFADQLVTVRPEVFQVIGPEVIRLKNLGPIGDAIVELLEAMQPPQIQQLKKGGQGMSPREQQMAAQLKQAQGVIQQLQQILQTEQTKAESQQRIKALEGQIKLALQQLQGDQKLQQLAFQAETAAADREDGQRHEMAMAGADAAQQARAADDAAYQAEKQALFGRSSA